MVTYTRELSVRYEADVFVVGGGPAGCAAAYAAAKQGKKVILAEQCGALGGMGTLGRVPMFCMFTDGERFLSNGFGKLVHDICLSRGAAAPDDDAYRREKRESISIGAEKLKKIYDDLLTGVGVELHFFTKLIDAQMCGDKIDYAVCSGQSGVFAVKAAVYIDCTGDGVLAYYAGAQFEKGDAQGKMQPGTLCSLWSNIDWERARESGYHGPWPNNGKWIAQAYADGVFDRLDAHLPGMWRTGTTLGGGNLGHLFGVDGTDEMSLSRGVLEGRELLEQYKEYYNRYLAGFEKAELADSGALVGIRESRRIQGDYVLTYRDYLSRAVFADEIGRYNYQIDAHRSELGKESEDAMMWMEMKDGESYGIPYRCLTPAGIGNLLVAGRCISTDRYMQASVRVMPGCFITGQAAGIAAAVAADSHTSVRDVEFARIRSGLDRLIAEWED